MKHEEEFLIMAITGYDESILRLASRRDMLKMELEALRNRKPAKHPKLQPAPKKRQMSAEARARMAAAQKKRWAAFHKEKAKAA